MDAFQFCTQFDQTLLGSSTIRQKSLKEGFGTAQWMKQLISAA